MGAKLFREESMGKDKSLSSGGAVHAQYLSVAQDMLPPLQMHWSSERIWIMQDPGVNFPFFTKDCQEGRGLAGAAQVVVCGIGCLEAGFSGQ